jgi:deoxyribose-phosphate aldolase
MRKYSDPKVQIKAAGGVRTLDGLLWARDLGCARIGASATVAIMEEAKARLGIMDKKKEVKEDPSGY